MSKYYSQLNKDIKDYFAILSPTFPDWLNDYIDTKELLSQEYINITCGTIYSDILKKLSLKNKITKKIYMN